MKRAWRKTKKAPPHNVKRGAGVAWGAVPGGGLGFWEPWRGTGVSLNSVFRGSAYWPGAPDFRLEERWWADFPHGVLASAKEAERGNPLI